MKSLFVEFRTSLLMTVCLTLVVCGMYPLGVWALGQLLFPLQANGSFVEVEGKTMGSSLIGQPFSGPTYFHARPSAAGTGYDATSSGGSNRGPLSKNLLDDVGERIAAYRHTNGLKPTVTVPSDAVTASASGLDPHISVANALLQAPRVAQARGIAVDKVRGYVETFTSGRQYGLLGEPRVNVLLLNLALDGKTGK
jgi:potassium-transporting ATPase KdpC subunit